MKILSKLWRFIITIFKKQTPIAPEEEQYAIVINENKGNVLIKCWNDGKETWVRKGSPCHMTGLCSKCIGEVL